MLPSMAGRPGVAGRRCLGVAKEDRLKAGVRDVEALLVGEKRPGSEKRTLLDFLVDGVLTCAKFSDVVRGLTGEDSTLLRRFGFRRAIGKSMSIETATAA